MTSLTFINRSDHRAWSWNGVPHSACEDKFEAAEYYLIYGGNETGLKVDVDIVLKHCQKHIRSKGSIFPQKCYS